MDLNSTIEGFLHYGWDAAERRRVIELVHHLESSPECQSALEEHDRIRPVLASTEEVPEPTGGWEAMETRLEDRLRDAFAPGAAATGRTCELPDQRVGHPKRRRHKVAKRLLFASAACLAGFWIGRELPRDAPGAKSSSNWPSSDVAFSPADLADNAKLFRQISQVFDQRASWVIVSDGFSDLGLDGMESENQQRVLMLRLVLSNRHSIMSQADLMLVRGESAEIDLPTRDGRRLRYHITSSADGPAMVSLWLEVHHGAGESASADGVLAATLPVEPGRVADVGRMATATGECDLRMSVAELAPAEAQG